MIHGIVLVVRLIKDLCDIDKDVILVGCDGKEALLQSVSITDETTSSQQSQFGFLIDIQGFL